VRGSACAACGSSDPARRRRDPIGPSATSSPATAARESVAISKSRLGAPR
jgi:hypothetical protein